MNPKKTLETFLVLKVSLITFAANCYEKGNYRGYIAPLFEDWL